MASDDKNWAQSYVNAPLTEPTPAEETGPGASLQRIPETPTSSTTPITPSSSRLSSNNPFRRSIDHGIPKEASVSTTEKTYPSPPPSASPRRSVGSNSHRQEFLGSTSGTRPRRSSSLKERYPDDPTVHPLDQLAREKARADRARLTTKKHKIHPDTIDDLDDSGLGHYHHEGPYDATLFARNNSYKSSPVAAVQVSNTEALRATPHEKIVDSVQRHHPLDGVAATPPGMMDRNGQTYDYREGDNMMVEENAGGGPYKRWPGVQYHPADIKGKGEPSYSIEKALKDHNLEERDGQGVEMQSGSSMEHGRTESGSRRESGQGYNDYRAALNDGEPTSEVRRRSSVGDKIRQRVGSLKKKVT